MVKADISERDRPLSVNLFMGPTGVGKTEIVRLLAQALHGRADGFCRIDMHTLAQEHYAAALTGAPPGYVGSKEGISLFNSELIQGTYSRPGIVLFDELEKASQEVVRNSEGAIEIEVAPRARAGNWLPTGGIEHYVLMLRLYDTPVGVATRTQRDAPMPSVTTGGCS